MGHRKATKIGIEEALKLKADEEELAKYIGIFVIEFNRLEIVLGEAITDLIGMRQESDRRAVHIFAAGLSFPQKIDMIVALYCDRYKTDERDCATLKNELYAINDFRNDVIHSQYYLIVDALKFVRKKGQTKGGKGLRFSEESAKELTDKIGTKVVEMRRMAQELENLTNSLWVSS